MKRKNIKYLVFMFIALFGVALNVSAANFTCKVDGYTIEYDQNGNIVGAKYSSGADVKKSLESYFKPKSSAECPNDITAKITFIDGNRTLYVAQMSEQVGTNRNFICKINEYNVEYNSVGEIVGATKSSGEKIDGVTSWKSNIHPTNSSGCPSSDAKISTLLQSNGEFYVKKFAGTANFNPSGDYEFTDNIAITSCSSITSKSICQNNDYFACVWDEKNNYCNVDNLQYVMCGDAHDVPAQIPPLTSLAVYLLKIATPIILIIVSIITLVKAIMSSKDDEIKKAQSSLIKKVVTAIIIFFVISIVQFVISKVADDDEQTSLAACMNCFLNNKCSSVKYYKDNINGEYYCYNVETKSGGLCDNFYYTENEVITTFTCNVGGYILKYDSGGNFISAIDSKGVDVALESDFSPKRSAQCPNDNNAEIRIRYDGTNVTIYVSRKN